MRLRRRRCAASGMVPALERPDDLVVLRGRALDPRRLAHVHLLVAQQRALDGAQHREQRLGGAAGGEPRMEVVVGQHRGGGVARPRRACAGWPPAGPRARPARSAGDWRIAMLSSTTASGYSSRASTTPSRGPEPRAAPAGQLAGPAQQGGHRHAGHLLRARHVIPQVEHALEVAERLRQAGHGLGLAGGLQRGGERLLRPPRRDPVLRQLAGARPVGRRGRGRGARARPRALPAAASRMPPRR